MTEIQRTIIKLIAHRLDTHMECIQTIEKRLTLINERLLHLDDRISNLENRCKNSPHSSSV